MAASVPPSDWPINKDFVPEVSLEIVSTQSKIAKVYSSSPLFAVRCEAGIHSRR
jgi:hypothetical protein